MLGSGRCEASRDILRTEVDRELTIAQVLSGHAEDRAREATSIHEAFQWNAHDAASLSSGALDKASDASG